MKKVVIALMALSFASYAQTTYNLYRTTITCTNDQSDLVVDGYLKIKSAMDGLVRDGKLITHEGSLTKSKDNTKLRFVIPAENEKQYQEILSQWKKSYDQIELTSFWKSCSKRKDTIMNKTRVMYPVIKNVWSPVAVVEGIDELPDAKMAYNIVVDFASTTERGENKSKIDSAAINWGLSDLARIYNLHAAAGIPKEKINIVLAIHGKATESFFNNKEYQARYKMDNPNIVLIEDLSKAGVKFTVCGQSLNWFGYNKAMLLPQAKVTLTAQTTLTSYQLKGFIKKDMFNE